jgi:predicted TIM-barrel fold metal-dependent hydrolase
MIIDTHAHVAEPCLLARTVAAIERGFPILPVEDLIREMERHGVSHAVLVQWGSCFDHHYLARCLRDFTKRFVAVGEVEFRRDDACQTLRCLVEKHGFRGVRIGTTDRSPGRDPLALWKAAADLDAIVSASARTCEDFAAGLTEVLHALPRLRIRIEHLARPPYREALPQDAFEQVMRFADAPNVAINLDGFYRHHYPDHRQLTTFPFSEYQAYVRRAVDAFGAERCMWGSEFPFLNNGYDTGVRFLRETCGYLSAVQRKWILGRSAAEFWGFDAEVRRLTPVENNDKTGQ